MLLNPMDREQVSTYPGTRLLQLDAGATGTTLVDPDLVSRHWTIEALYAPLYGRALGGVRAKLVDGKGFVSFCNQRDLEVLLGIARPGDWCRWLGQEYVPTDSEEWCGICADEEDLLDDLYDRELLLRGASPTGILSPPLEFTRRVHLGANMDFQELHLLMNDCMPETGYFPDPRFETVERRWVRSHRERIRWDRI